MAAPICDVRFTPESGHDASGLRCPLCAISGLMHRSKIYLYSRLELVRQLPIEPLIFFPQICNGHDLVGSEWASLLESGRLRKINLPGGPA
jgi:hypothetical protein